MHAADLPYVKQLEMEYVFPVLHGARAAQD